MLQLATMQQLQQITLFSLNELKFEPVVQLHKIYVRSNLSPHSF